MRRDPLRQTAVVMTLIFGALSVAACAPTQEGAGPEMTPPTQEDHEPEVAAAVEASSENIISAEAVRVRSGLGVNLYVTFFPATSSVSADELEAALRAAAPVVPDDLGVIRFTARDANEATIPLTDPAQQIGLPELAVKTGGVIAMSPAALRELYAE